MSNEIKYIKTKINYLLNIFKHTIYRYPNYYFMFYKKNRISLFKNNNMTYWYMYVPTILIQLLKFLINYLREIFYKEKHKYD